MKQIDFNVGASRRDLLKTTAVAGAGALVPWESSMAQGAKKGTGKPSSIIFDLHTFLFHITLSSA